MTNYTAPNGAGKSTTIRILMNFIHADSGTARIGGLDCRLRSRDIKRFSGYMPSEVRCYPSATGRELLDYACRLRGDKKGKWKELAEYFSFDAGKRFREYSIGNRRKLSIIQAMMSEPRLLILDEPTGGLDPLMQEKFFDALLSVRSKGTTVFFSSHNLNEVQKYCSRVALVKNGHIEMMPEPGSMNMYAVEIATSADCGALIDAVCATDVRRASGVINFMMPGENLKQLTEALSGMDISDITVAKPSLEQMFRKIYLGEEAGK